MSNDIRALLGTAVSKRHLDLLKKCDARVALAAKAAEAARVRSLVADAVAARATAEAEEATREKGAWMTARAAKKALVATQKNAHAAEVLKLAREAKETLVTAQAARKAAWQKGREAWMEQARKAADAARVREKSRALMTDTAIWLAEVAPISAPLNGPESLGCEQAGTVRDDNLPTQVVDGGLAETPETTKRTLAEELGAQAVLPKGKGKAGRPTINEGWEVAAFAAELGFLQDGVDVTNEAIFNALPAGTVGCVNDVKRMRDRHQREAKKEAKGFAAAYLKKAGLGVGRQKSDRQNRADALAKEHHWRAYLEGGHKGDWGYLESILDRELARQSM